MVDGRCELCRQIVPKPRACHKQTKYCEECARSKKRASAHNSWPAQVKAVFMRKYMRAYRQSHPGLSTAYVRKHREKLKSCSGNATYLSCISLLLSLLLLLLLVALLASGRLHYDALPKVISYLELLAVKVTGLIVIVLICWKHLKQFWNEMTHPIGSNGGGRDAAERRDHRSVALLRESKSRDRRTLLTRKRRER